MFSKAPRFHESTTPESRSQSPTPVVTTSRQNTMFASDDDNVPSPPSSPPVPCRFDAEEARVAENWSRHQTNLSPVSDRRADGRHDTTLLAFRDSVTSLNQDGDDRASGSPPGRKETEKEASHATKRPLSNDRKFGPPDKKKTSQRELKRTTSFIPRATPAKVKSPTVTEAKKTNRKSETSLKNKEVLEESKGKKLESGRTSKTTLNPRTSRENDCDKAESDRAKADLLLRNLSSTKVGKSYSKSNYSNDLSMMRYSDRSESRTRGAGSSVDDSAASHKNLEAQFAAKRTVYAIMVKEFKDKQKAISEQYKILQELQRKILAHSGKEIPLEDTIVLSDVRKPFVLCESSGARAGGKSDTRRVITFETKVFDHMTVNVSDYQARLDNLMCQSREVWSDLLFVISNSRKEMRKKLTERYPNLDPTWLESEEKRVDEAVQNAKYQSKVKAEEMVIEMKKLYLHYETLRQELKIITDGDRFAALITKDYREMANKVKELDEELAKEKIKNEDLREKRNMLEETNMAESEKIESLEQELSTQQRKLVALTTECKTLKQKKVMANRTTMGLKGKDLKDLKAKSELLKALENHIAELTNDYNAQKKTLQDRILDLERSLGEKEEELKAETQAKLNLEASLAEAEEKIRNVREKKKAITEMVDKTKMLQSTNESPTKREEQLWTELEAAKIIARGYQDELVKMQEEKAKILLKFQAISEDKSNQNSERLAADLLRKEEIIKTLKEQVTELQNTCEEHSTKYNKLLAQMKEVHEKMDGKSDAAALSKQLGDVKMQKKELQEAVQELVTHNEELETALVQRSLELDQRDRLVKQQCNLLKMRDELTDLVRNKDEAQYQGVKKVMEQSSRWEKKAEKIYKDLEKKANELDDMYKVLVEKQKQIEKLTRLVKAMEDQQDRAQQQRVRFESKIAELQRQLSEGRQKRLKTQLFK